MLYSLPNIFPTFIVRERPTHTCRVGIEVITVMHYISKSWRGIATGGLMGSQTFAGIDVRAGAKVT